MTEPTVIFIDKSGCRHCLKPVERWGILLLMSTFFISGCYKDAGDKAAGVPVQVAEAKRAPISLIVSADAVLYPLNQAAMSPKISAPVSRFYVARGAHVRRGELLAVLENKDLEAAAAENKGLYEQAQAGYETTTAATLPEEIQKAEFDAQSTKEVYETQQKVYEGRQILFKQGAIPRRDLDQAAVAFTQARQQYQIAEKHLKSLQAVGRQQELKAASGQLTAAKGKFMGAEAQLSYSQIRSPIDGVVTDRPLYAGEVAPAGTPLITVMNISQVIARTHIPQSEAMLLKKGDSATITAPGLDPMEGKVVLVNPATDPNSTTVEVWVQIANPKERLRPGTTVRLSALAQTVPDAIVIPASAVLTSSVGGGTSVMIVEPDGTAMSKDVQVGIRQGDLLQAVSGIKVGDQIIQSGAYGLPDKTKVSVEKQDQAQAEAAGSKDKPASGNDKDKD